MGRVQGVTERSQGGFGCVVVVVGGCLKKELVGGMKGERVQPQAFT